MSRSTAGRRGRRTADRRRPSAATAGHAPNPRPRVRAPGAGAGRPAERQPGVRLQVEPPGWMTLVPAVHRRRHEVGTVLDVADDDAALVPGLPPDGREAQRTPAALVCGGPQDATTAEPVERSMSAPGRVDEPLRQDMRRSGCRGAQARPQVLTHADHPQRSMLTAYRRPAATGSGQCLSITVLSPHKPGPVPWGGPQ